MYAIYELAADQMWYKRAAGTFPCPIPGTISLPVEQYDQAPADLSGFILGTLYGAALIKNLQKGDGDGVSGE